MTKEQYRERKEKGLCTICQKPNSNGKTRCDECNNKSKIQAISRTKKGICPRCGKEHNENTIHCIDCKVFFREKQKQKYAERKQQNICPRCGKAKSNNNKVYCDNCSNEKKQIEKEMIKNHICPRCGKEKIYLNEKMCYSCSEKLLENNRRYYRQNRSKILAQKKIYDTRVKSERESQGLCKKCGKRPALSGQKNCGICNEKNRNCKSVIEKRKGIKKIEYGKCVFCGADAKENYKLCEKHYNIAVKNLENVDRSYFRNQNKLLYVK